MRMDEKALKAAMRKMGIQSQDVDAQEVIIRTPTKDIIITNPSVTKVNMMGQHTFQIIGNVTEKEKGVSEEDIKTVMEQAKADRETAKKALEKSDGDLAEAIMSLSKNEF